MIVKEVFMKQLYSEWYPDVYILNSGDEYDKISKQYLEKDGLLLPYTLHYHDRMSNKQIGPAITMKYKSLTTKQAKSTKIKGKVWNWNTKEETELGVWTYNFKWDYICKSNGLNNWSKYVVWQKDAILDRQAALLQNKPVADVDKNKNETIPVGIHPLILKTLHIPIPTANEIVKVGATSIKEAEDNFIKNYKKLHATYAQDSAPKNTKKKKKCKDKDKKKHTRKNDKKKRDKKKKDKKKKDNKKQDKHRTKSKISKKSSDSDSETPSSKTAYQTKSINMDSADENDSITSNLIQTKNTATITNNNNNNSFGKSNNRNRNQDVTNSCNDRVYFSNIDTYDQEITLSTIELNEKSQSLDNIVFISDNDYDSDFGDDEEFLKKHFPQLKLDPIHVQIVQTLKSEISKSMKKYWQDKYSNAFEKQGFTVVITENNDSNDANYDSMASFGAGNDENSNSNKSNNCNRMGNCNEIPEMILSESESEIHRTVCTSKSSSKPVMLTSDSPCFNTFDEITNNLQSTTHMGKNKSRNQNELLCALGRHQTIEFKTPPDAKNVNKNKNNGNSSNGKAEIENNTDNDENEMSNNHNHQNTAATVNSISMHELHITDGVQEFDVDFEANAADESINELIESEIITPVTLSKSSVGNSINISHKLPEISEVTLSDSENINIQSNSEQSQSSTCDLKNSKLSYNLNDQERIANKLNANMQPIMIEPLQTNEILLQTPQTERRKDLQKFQKKSTKAGKKFMQKQYEINGDYNNNKHMVYGNINENISENDASVEDNDINIDSTQKYGQTIKRPTRKAKSKAKQKLKGFDRKQQETDEIFAQREKQERREDAQKRNNKKQKKTNDTKQKKRGLQNDSNNMSDNNKAFDAPSKKKRKICKNKEVEIGENDTRSIIDKDDQVSQMDDNKVQQISTSNSVCNLESQSSSESHSSHESPSESESESSESDPSQDSDISKDMICEWLKHIWSSKKCVPVNKKCDKCSAKFNKRSTPGRRCSVCQFLVCSACMARRRRIIKSKGLKSGKNKNKLGKKRNRR